MFIKATFSDDVIENSSSRKDEEAIDPDYNEIPIEKFGMAFLRGCGWTEASGIGKTNRRITPLKIYEQRPRGLGLGAAVTAVPIMNNNQKTKAEN